MEKVEPKYLEITVEALLSPDATRQSLQEGLRCIRTGDSQQNIDYMQTYLARGGSSRFDLSSIQQRMDALAKKKALV